MEGLWFNVWSMSIDRQLEIMTSKAFESGINKKDPIFQMKDFRIMYDWETSDVHDAGSVGEDWGGIVSHDEYPAGMITVISVNCTTINQEFNPNDPENNSLFAFDPKSGSLMWTEPLIAVPRVVGHEVM